MQRLLRGSPKAGKHGVPTRSWILNRLRDVGVDAEGLRTSKIHCDAATNLLGVFVRKQAVSMVYDTSKSAEGFGA